MLKMVAQQKAAKDPRQWLDKGATPLSLIASMLSCMAELMKEVASIAEGDTKMEQSLDGEHYDWWHHDSQYNRWNDTNRYNRWNDTNRYNMWNDTNSNDCSSSQYSMWNDTNSWNND